MTAVLGYIFKGGGNNGTSSPVVALPNNPATQSVLHLPELLSDILLYLPFEQVMRTRGVCQHWKAVIDTDPNILWHTWRSTTAPITPRKKLSNLERLLIKESQPIQSSPDDPSPKNKKKRRNSSNLAERECYFEPFRPFFERNLINTNEWITPLYANIDPENPTQRAPPIRTMQRTFIKTSLAEFLTRHATTLSRFYITRPPLKKVESSIRVITAMSGTRANCAANTLDKGFTIVDENGITVYAYLKGLLECLESSWGRIRVPQPMPAMSLDERYLVENGVEELCLPKNLQSKHRLEAQLVNMTKEFVDYDDDDDDEGEEAVGGDGESEDGGEDAAVARLKATLEEWENGVMNSTLIMKVHYSVVPEVAPRVQKKGWRQWLLGW
ncbi:hypothetical protein TWF694_009506 [Orbilia ellipsospora]|uniref:F-box domain-containing protein n=1 Tax=Orbilia ellipsospora TaxID=2528407 RepID=A0AAV9XCD3_9PEZI